MKVVVLGANSFSGQDLVDLLLERGEHQVIGVSRSPERSALHLAYRTRSDLSRYAYHQIDLNSGLDELCALLDRERPAWIVNFAAQSEVAPSWVHPEHWFQTNCVALAGLVNHLRHQDYLERYLHISSPEVYGSCVGTVREDAPFNPSTPYAASKAAADMLLETFRRQYGLPLLTVRATNVYGARQQLFKIIPRTAIYCRLGRRVSLHGGGVAIKSFIHIRDVSVGELAILERGRLGEIYHLSPDGGVAVRDVVRQVVELSGLSFAEATEVVDERPGQDAAYVIDSSKARAELGWTPGIGLEQGLAEVVEWVDEYWAEISAAPLDYRHQP
jgi:dTDP-glucose 4,6-dehydratase